MLLHTVQQPYTVLCMSQKLTDDQEGEAVVLALRLPQKLIDALDQVQREQESEMRVKARLSRSSVARALLEEALRRHGALSEPSDSKPKEPVEPAPVDPEPTPHKKAKRSSKAVSKRKGSKSTPTAAKRKSKSKRSTRS